MQYRKSTISSDCILTSILFIIFPLFSTPLIIKGMIQCKKWAFFLWACFMGLLGILYPPVGDIYKYTLDFQTYKGLDWNSFLYFISFKFDYLLSFVSYAIGIIDLNFDLSRFIYNFIGYLILGNICLDIIGNNNSIKGNRSAIIYTIFIFIHFNIITYLWRFGLSTAFFAYGAYFIVYKNNKKGWFYISLSVLSHFSFIIFAIGLLFYRLFKLKKWSIAILCICTLFIDSRVASLLFQYLPISIIEQYSGYIDGYYANEYVKDHSFRYQLYIFLTNSITYVAILIYLITYKNRKRNDGVISLTNTILVIACLSLPFDTLRTRFLAVLLLFIKMSVLYFYDYSKRSKLYLKILCLAVIFGNCMSVWSIRRQIEISDYSILLYSTAPQIICHTYDNKWINTHILPNGDISVINY